MTRIAKSHFASSLGFAGGFVLGAVVTTGLQYVTVALSSTLHEFTITRTVTSRTYRPENTGWQACGVGRSDGDRERCGGDSNGVSFACSDGTRLTRATYECSSPRGAQRELQARIYGLDNKPPEWSPVQTIDYDGGVLAQLGDLSPIEADILVDGNQWLYARVIGNDLVVISGPSREHIVEIIDAKPRDLWRYDGVAPN